MVNHLKKEQQTITFLRMFSSWHLSIVLQRKTKMPSFPEIETQTI